MNKWGYPSQYARGYPGRLLVAGKVFYFRFINDLVQTMLKDVCGQHGKIARSLYCLDEGR